MTREELRQLMSENNLTAKTLAKLIGKTERMVKNYISPSKPHAIPKTVEIAIKSLYPPQ